jgi:hypothetical protein
VLLAINKSINQRNLRTWQQNTRSQQMCCWCISFHCSCQSVHILHPAPFSVLLLLLLLLLLLGQAVDVSMRPQDHSLSSRLLGRFRTNRSRYQFVFVTLIVLLWLLSMHLITRPSTIPNYVHLVLNYTSSTMHYERYGGDQNVSFIVIGDYGMRSMAQDEIARALPIHARSFKSQVRVICIS